MCERQAQDSGELLRKYFLLLYLIFLILLQVGNVSSSMRREEGEDSDTDEEVFDNPSDAGRREETVELIKLLENIVT